MERRTKKKEQNIYRIFKNKGQHKPMFTSAAELEIIIRENVERAKQQQTHPPG